MEDFVKFAVEEGGSSEKARLLWRSGVTESLIRKAKEIGLSYKDIEEVYFSFGATSVLVIIEVVSRAKK